VAVVFAVQIHAAQKGYGFKTGIVMKNVFRLISVMILLLHGRAGMGQQTGNRQSKPTMTSGRLITLDDYYPDALLLLHSRRDGDTNQTDNRRLKPTMTSGRLITLDDYHPDMVYGSSYLEMINKSKLQKKSLTLKSVFNYWEGSKFILPALFITYGTVARFNQLPVRRLDLDIDRGIRKHVTRRYRVDDYFLFGMPLLAEGLGFIPGIEARHNFRDRTLIMATSLFVTAGVADILKRTTSVMRPGQSDRRSFPSAHMALTMMSAHVMYREYKDISPWIGVGGYVVATATGVFRMLNRAHWLSDVVMGAGIGLLGAEIGYMMLPVWHSVFGIKDTGKQFAAVPAFSTRSIGLGLVCSF
jgi:membrane-associated phospholipid phosphatase